MQHDIFVTGKIELYPSGLDNFRNETSLNVFFFRHYSCNLRSKMFIDFYSSNTIFLQILLGSEGDTDPIAFPPWILHWTSDSSRFINRLLVYIIYCKLLPQSVWTMSQSPDHGQTTIPYVTLQQSSDHPTAVYHTCGLWPVIDTRSARLASDFVINIQECAYFLSSAGARSMI